MMPIPLAIAPFVPAWNTPGFALEPFIGGIILIITIAALLLTPFFVPRRSNLPCGAIALIGLFAAFFSLLAVHRTSMPANEFSGMLINDSIAFFFKALLYLFTAGVVLVWFSATSVSMHEGDGAEFFVLLLGATLGMSLMASTSNLLMIFLAIELASLPSYVLAGFRKTERLGAEASLKYVLFGAASSSIMVFGLSYLYGLSGSLNITAIAHTPASPVLAIALVCVLAGVGFKIALVPLHFWCPNVFEGAGVDVGAFLSVASKGAGLILLMRIMVLVGQTNPKAIAIGIAVLGALTATVANTAALSQTNIKRLLAYSSIAHAGYMLCALPLLLTPHSQTAVQAILIYLAVYLFMNLGAFMVAGLVERQEGSTEISAFAGLGRRSPLLAACMTIFLFSLIGLPPLAGFIAKLNIMWLLGSAGAGWWVLVVVITINTIISVYYYAKVLKAMYFVPSESEAFFPNPIGLGIATICATMLLAMLVFFSFVSNTAARYAHIGAMTTVASR